jgi:Tfp pilus assembly protein PilV
MIKNIKGFSLVEALIASVVLMTAAMGFNQYFSMKSKNIKNLSSKLNSNQHNLVISQLLRDKDICQLMLRGKTFTKSNISSAKLTDLKILSVVSTTPLTAGDVLYEAGTKLDGGLKIKSIDL